MSSPHRGRNPSGVVVESRQFASNLLGAGVDVVTVLKTLGHSNPPITFTVYAHAIPKERHGAGDALARLRAQSGNKMETSAPEAASVAC